jgi:UrcA family protein
MFTKTLIAAGLVGLALTAQPAAAQLASSSAEAVEVQHRTVNYADLDMATPEGQARLDARLRRAAAAVCESNYGPHPLSEAMEARRCYRTALQSARTTLASLGTAKITTIKMVSR